MSGYWQVPLDDDAKDKSAFCTREGLWRWKVLPFGLTAAPATFQRLMERVLQGLHWKSLLLYLDDVIIIGNTFQQHYDNLVEVLNRLRQAGLKLKPSKCHLFQKEVIYLGHVVSSTGVSTDPEKISAVADWPVPKNLTELQSFLGLTGYYRQYVEGFATKARPLTKLTGKNVKFYWTDECQDAFDSLKQALLTAPVLGYPDPALHYILDTDASLSGVGAVLSQVQNGNERVISYYSRALSPSQQNYCVTRRELLAVVKAVAHFRPYLYGKEFRIRTDHASLLWLCRRTTPSAQVARWLEILSEFSFTIEHRPGVKHGNADSLSRRPCQDCKKCERVNRLCGGPTIDEINEELKIRSQTEELVQTKIDGENLCALECTEDIFYDCAEHLPKCTNHLESSDNNPHLACQLNVCAEASCAAVEDSINSQHDANRSVTDSDYPDHEQLNLTNGSLEQSNNPQSPSVSEQSFNNGIYSSEVLCQAQSLPGDVATIYNAVQHQQELDKAMVSLGSPELRKLYTMYSLMKIREDGVLVVRILIGNRPREVILCPASLRDEVMWATHTFSHAGIGRSLRRIRLTWYWPGMASQIRRIVKSCEICQLAKSGGLQHRSSQGNLKVGRPWQKVAIDLVGPMPETTRNNKWILVLTDHFTRWQDALPIPDATARVVAEALDCRVFCYFGLPEEIHSDRGMQFEGEFMTELCRLWRVIKTRTTSYHPQSNGMVERGNRTLGDSLRSLLLQYGEEQESWDMLLPQILRSFRATPHAATEETANYLMLGRECRLPDQLLDGTHSVQTWTNTNYVIDLQNRLLTAHELLRSQQMLPSRSADNEEESLFKKGDFVLVENKRKKKGVHPKLQPKFAGPFPVRKVFSNGTYKIANKGTINECRLKLFTPCANKAGQPDRPEPEDEVRMEYQSLVEPDEWAASSDVGPEEQLVEIDDIHSPGIQIDRSYNEATGRTKRVRKLPSYLAKNYIVY